MEPKQEGIISSASHDTCMTHGSGQLPKIKTKSLVRDIPFSIKLVRLSEATIRRYTKQPAPIDIHTPASHVPTRHIKGLHVKPLSILVRKLPLAPKQHVILHTPRKDSSSAATNHKTAATQGGNKKKQFISGHPSHLKRPLQYTFQIQRHVLKKKHKTKVYLKCRIPGCKLAYVTHHSVKELNSRHRMYHSGVTYQCPTCSKTLITPTAMKWHMYSHCQQLYKCDKCSKTFVYKSKLQQHKHRHLRHKLYQCCFGGYQKKYCHP